jgi:hypothetical protein
VATTFVKIQTITVGSGGASTLDFTSIPQTFTDLKLVLSSRGSGSGANFVKFNNSTIGVTQRYILGTGSATAAGSDVVMYMGEANYSTFTASTFASSELYIPNYTSANQKSSSSTHVQETNTTAAYAGFNANLWANTAAITQITIYLSAGTYVEYTTATLYGIKSS